GITCRPFQAGTSGIVPFDAHGFNGADNSSYSGGTARLQFGEGGVDDSEDADVIIHELGHGIHHFLVGTGGGPSNSEGLSEGFGDYVAVSYGRSLGLLAPADPEWNWVFKWDGHNEWWGGRITNYSATYPTGSAPHDRGQHWSTSNLRIWNTLGREVTDRAVFQGLRLTGVSSTQPQAAQAVLQAARNMGYAQASLDLMLASYVQQGYTVTMPPVANEAAPGASASLALGVPMPNPVAGRATLSLSVGQAQDVEVALFDVVGRQVATLFTGAVAAGEVPTLTIDTAALPAGVYVVRATGGQATAVRTLTVTR
ncbi:MAG TPA: T9SS type A sorting domain-containing protein, partial [Rhodothermales bacterium]|nr:T9SS type A sorting domain-containing protein [Rhodothermales bacterium]